jgi:magnesium-transporting ATPase (P-type)
MWRIKFASKMKFKAVKDRLRIIARATDEDKLILIQGIKQEGGLVAMSGEKTSDATALKMASVGLCMGSGCTVAKENSDLVITDNDFRSIHHAIMWGRTIFGNVRKFMQFQLTINITLCLIILLSSVSLGNSPFNVIQLLWINLIMDTLATIAICTEPFEVKNVSEASTARISRKDRIMNAVMWRNILGQSLYQLLAILILMYAGHAMFFDEPFNLITEKMRYDESDPENGIVANDPTNKMVLHTFIFHTFVLMSLFNQVNCRLIYEDDLNIFRTMFNNSWFWLVFIFEMLLQNYMIYMAPTYQLS